MKQNRKIKNKKQNKTKKKGKGSALFESSDTNAWNGVDNLSNEVA
jgi:hypothetical protein